MKKISKLNKLRRAVNEIASTCGGMFDSVYLEKTTFGRSVKHYGYATEQHAIRIQQNVVKHGFDADVVKTRNGSYRVWVYDYELSNTVVNPQQLCLDM